MAYSPGRSRSGVDSNEQGMKRRRQERRQARIEANAIEITSRHRWQRRREKLTGGATRSHEKRRLITIRHHGNEKEENNKGRLL